ncbi:hypothetical protein F889_01893 [Acinetobacter colistiniresistens]|uniref:SMI1/KNR4 family protein n=1 Tax=Acinetobacter colistiniresistens TaxID=280145 RepID=N9R7L3_9GAMM|nr:hypothetical protein [Acinetobacter colistiniresistens]ENX34605.1 hypothetical protein F889_01893 [Acinetobacter colistiniresistens]
MIINIKLLHDEMLKKGIRFETGLTYTELEAIEQLFAFHFPIDLKIFLNHYLPISEKAWGFPNWRKALCDDQEKNMIIDRLNYPKEGIAFDIQQGFWLDEWGIAPNEVSERLTIFENNFKKYPMMIPIYSHRYIPVVPYEAENPIFSIMQTDIIYYGTDLINYFCNEFSLNKNIFDKQRENHKHIKFWSQLVQ